MLNPVEKHSYSIHNREIIKKTYHDFSNTLVSKQDSNVVIVILSI